MAKLKRPNGYYDPAKAEKKKAQQFAAAESSNLGGKLFAAAQALFVILTLLKLTFEVIEQFRTFLF